jgi:hypothetical protein
LEKTMATVNLNVGQPQQPLAATTSTQSPNQITSNLIGSVADLLNSIAALLKGYSQLGTANPTASALGQSYPGSMLGAQSGSVPLGPTAQAFPSGSGCAASGVGTPSAIAQPIAQGVGFQSSPFGGPSGFGGASVQPGGNKHHHILGLLRGGANGATQGINNSGSMFGAVVNAAIGGTKGVADTAAVDASATSKRLIFGDMAVSAFASPTPTPTVNPFAPITTTSSHMF